MRKFLLLVIILVLISCSSSNYGACVSECKQVQAANVSCSMNLGGYLVASGYGTCDRNVRDRIAVHCYSECKEVLR